MERPCCGNCRFWREVPPGETGRCHRRPPTPVVFVHTIVGEHLGDVREEFVDYQTLWPLPKRHEWCGDHECPSPA